MMFVFHKPLSFFKKQAMNKPPIQKSFQQFFIQKILLTAAVVLVSAGFPDISHAFGVPPAASATPGGAANPFVGSTDAARKGEELFGRNCQQCHNTRGHGGKCPQLVRGAWAPDGANSDIFMYETISNGRPNTQMGAWGQALSENEIWEIVTFLREEAVRVKAADGRKNKDADEDLWY